MSVNIVLTCDVCNYATQTVQPAASMRLGGETISCGTVVLPEGWQIIESRLGDLLACSKCLRRLAENRGRSDRPPLKEACHRFAEHLGRPRWLSSIGSGADRIVVFLRAKPPKPLPDEWEGWPVDVKWFGEFAPLGGDPDA